MNIEEVSKEVLYDWEQKVSDKWLKRNKARGEAQRSANSVPIIGAIYQVILIIFSAILYILYKQQLPYEMYIWTLIVITSMFSLNKYIAYSELNLIGEPATSVVIPTSRSYWANPESTSGIEPTHTEYINYLKHIKKAAIFLALVVTAITVSIHFFTGDLYGDEVIFLILGLIVFVVQMIHMSSKLLDGIDERGRKVHAEMMVIANEMEKEGLIKRPPDGFN